MSAWTLSRGRATNDPYDVTSGLIHDHSRRTKGAVVSRFLLSRPYTTKAFALPSPYLSFSLSTAQVPCAHPASILPVPASAHQPTNPLQTGLRRLAKSSSDNPSHMSLSDL